MRYNLSGEMYRARRPSRNSRVSFPGRATSARTVVAKRPSHPESSQNASMASSRTLGYGGTSRWPHFEQNGPVSAAPQLRQPEERTGVAGPCNAGLSPEASCCAWDMRPIYRSPVMSGRRKRARREFPILPLVSPVFESLFRLSQAVRYVAIYRHGVLTMAERPNVRVPSSGESDRYEELL